MWNYSITSPALKILLCYVQKYYQQNILQVPKVFCFQNIPLTPEMITRFLMLIY